METGPSRRGIASIWVRPETYAATVAAATSHHGPFSPRAHPTGGIAAVLPASSFGRLVCGLPREPATGGSRSASVPRIYTTPAPNSAATTNNPTATTTRTPRIVTFSNERLPTYDPAHPAAHVAPTSPSVRPSASTP